ncbi:16S rRNA (guanine(966)-N(2))-methyltransferase RsmD [Lacticaseibacillus thailandensis]|uniref:N6-adenine-specific methylase n=1 Tax=Lacticaseibacillus thailandensis DSM 22698 = JCM 13996 TaxID=1423810 RepID=A0A0R2CIU5_9LACO|nr:16S rRNA (guanine(966)-N(2))-methyltransferase RsmD [Lacticaseibacillus thailandensis]KRM88006.1 N6-adenine-specific methylase [Lacticaseibacillus thailandensis DSM 22698 = JCM 13996]
MRVVSGEFRGRRLNMVPGDTTRPTADKVKESIFNMVGPYFEGGQALDLYAGTGGLGIEAVSRGMDHATLVDSAYQAVKTIKQNVQLLKAADRFTVIKRSVQAACTALAAEHQQFDLVLMDPPYTQQRVLTELANFVQLDLLKPGATVVVETGMDVQYPDAITGYRIRRLQTYKVAQVLVLERNEDA